MIEWTDATWNPITGCSVISPGCKHCYAMKLAGTRLQHHRSRAGLTVATKAGPVWTGEVRFNEEWIAQPLRWRRPRRVFVCAHGDLFHEDVPDAWIDRVFDVMEARPARHIFQVLTKRSARMRDYISARWRLPESIAFFYDLSESTPLFQVPENIWLGVSIEDRERMLARGGDLANTPAAKTFWSVEPLIGPLGTIPDDLLPDWMIVGGESGDGARPMHIQWVRILRDHCASAAVPFFFKQWGEWQGGRPRPAGAPGRFALVPNENLSWAGIAYTDSYPRQFSAFGSSVMERIGKKAAGRLLDGVEHNGMPA
nr:phage Gp37/Gp68 family protein [Sphingobium boeckii]